MGICEHIGHAITFKILTNNTLKVINCSNVHFAGLPLEYNLRLDPLGGESKQIIKSKADNIMLPDDNNLRQSETKTQNVPLIEPSDLVSCSFLVDNNDDGDKFRGQIVEAIQDQQDKHIKDPTHTKFICCQ